MGSLLKSRFIPAVDLNVGSHTIPAKLLGSRPTVMKDHASSFLKALVHKYLHGNLLDSARFYAERLYYEAPCAESLHLLALCYYRSGKTKQAYLVLQDCMHNPMIASAVNKYLFAITCNDLDKLEEGEQALRQYSIQSSDKITLESVKDTPGGAEGVYLLGKLCRRQHRKDMAITYYRLSLRMDPYLWSAITELSEMGVAINVKELFNIPSQGTSRSVFEEGNTAEERPFQPLHSLEEKAGWISEIKHTNQERYYSANNVFSDSKSGTMERLQQFSAAEHLSGGVQVQDSAGRQASPGVSMSLGLSSMSLHVPFVSPSSMPSPPMSAHSALPAGPYAAPYTGMHTAGIAAEDSGYSGEALDLTMTMNMTDSGDSAIFSARRIRSDSYGDNESEGPTSGPYKAGLKDAKAALFGMGTPGLTPISSNAPTDATPGLHLGTDAHSNINTGVSTGNIMNRAVGVDLFGSSAPNSTVNSAAAPHAHSGAPRRVSFGPTARLSFSGALGGDAVSAQQAHIAQLRQAQTGGTASTSATDGADREDGYPYKLPRTDEEGGTSPASGTHRSAEDSNRQLPHKILMSPFPVESSPIPLPAGATGTTSGDNTFPSPSFRRRYGTRGSNASSVAQKAAEVENKENAQGAEELPSSPGNRVPPTHPHAQSHVTFSVHASAHYEHLHQAAVPRCPQVDQLVITLARAYQMLCLYFCRACIDELQTLPERHFRSALVSQWVGKAYYEMNQYKPAMLAFREMLRAEPFRLCGLETLSTALWHLKRDKELCTLAQQVVEVDKMAPECWCVVGNCFSLQREPDTAIKFFQRALQLDPSFTYAYTLCGHEQVNNEDMEKATESFRQALLYSDRHYNAWYGLGTIYYRQEKYELAECHFRRALAINPASSVLHCYLGMALHAQNNTIKTTEALDVLTRAAEKDPSNPQLHFQRAHILVAVDNLPEALIELNIVEEHAPREPPVHALLGQVHHRLGNLQLAIKHLNIAMDLDPKETASLKGILEHIDEPAMS